MTRRKGDVLHIEAEPAGTCELCGKKEEVRPYGPNGEDVCFECGMKDESAARKQLAKRLEGVDLVITHDATKDN